MTIRKRPLAFLDTAELLALAALLVAAAGWVRLVTPEPGHALVSPEEAVAVALAADTGLEDEEDVRIPLTVDPDVRTH